MALNANHDWELNLDLNAFVDLNWGILIWFQTLWFDLRFFENFAIMFEQ